MTKKKSKPEPKLKHPDHDKNIIFKVSLHTASRLARKYPGLSLSASVDQLIADTEPRIECAKAVPKRVAILHKGVALTDGDRNKAYGEAWINMQHMAGMLTAYFCNLLRSRLDIDTPSFKHKNTYFFTGEDAAQIMAIAKMSRTANRGVPYHEDNYTDQAVYSAMAGECADRERPIV